MNYTKGEWKDKPDSEGWWWYSLQGGYLKAKYPCYFYPDGNKVKEWGHEGLKDLSCMPESGKWSKAIVPE